MEPTICVVCGMELANDEICCDNGTDEYGNHIDATCRVCCLCNHPMYTPIEGHGQVKGE
jgi:hypothetical protein